jgi:hypothetical protein
LNKESHTYVREGRANRHIKGFACYELLNTAGKIWGIHYTIHDILSSRFAYQNLKGKNIRNYREII